MNFDMKLPSAEKSAIIQDQSMHTPDGWHSDTYNDVIYTTEPMAFIQSMGNGKLVVNPRARDMLSCIEKPLVVISIAGLYRTGNIEINPSLITTDILIKCYRGAIPDTPGHIQSMIDGKLKHYVP